jgi:hypothetical protein
MNLVLDKQRTNNSIVDYIGSIVGHGDETPDEKSTFHKPIQWEPIQKDIREELDNAKERKDHPIHEPFSIVMCWFAFNCFN